MNIEPEKLTITLINGSKITIRSLTLKERRDCIKFFPSEEDPNIDYFKVQGDLVHYIITRSVPSFKREDVDNLIDAQSIRKILTFALVDPFSELVKTITNV